MSTSGSTWRTGKEVFEGNSGDSTAMNSLYLKTTTYWNDADNYAYKIGNVQISCGGIFDEFVAYTAAFCRCDLDK